MQQPCHLEPAQLLDYLHGVASPELRRLVERSPECQAAARELASEIATLKQLLFRAGCPTEQTLVDFQERDLAGTEQLMVSRHVSGCDHCQEELRLLSAIDALPLAPQPGPLRRLVEALFHSPLSMAQAARGQMLHYKSPHLAINLSPRKSEGQPRSWTLRGQVRTHDGQLAGGLVEAVVLRSLDQSNEQRDGQIEPNGSFLFKGLPPGVYSLSVLTAQEEIVIRQLSVGDVP